MPSMSPKQRYAPVAADEDGSSVFDFSKVQPHHRRRRNALIVLVAAVILTALLYTKRTLVPRGCPSSDLSPHPFRFRTSSSTTTFSWDAAAAVDPNPDAPWPRVAWLLSYPNSGTSFTLKLVQRASNRTAATNYAREGDVATEGLNRPVRGDDDAAGGPYYLSSISRRVPDRYVLTKTHCGGRCSSCSPRQYVETERSFRVMCQTGGMVQPKADGTSGNNVIRVQYDGSVVVQRAVHLVRNPFDNVVSRFHLELKERKKRDEQSWLARYPNTPGGFQEWCRQDDGKRMGEIKESRFFDDGLSETFAGGVCFGEFYRYVQWHNLAISVVHSMGLPTLFMHYENYDRDLEGTLTTLLEFLELPHEGETSEFLSGKNYDEYYSDGQRSAAMSLIKELANPEAWDILKRYDVG